MNSKEPRQPITPVRCKDGTVENFMPRIAGKPFRCDCKCNVFHKPDATKPELYECNCCGHRYEGA